MQSLDISPTESSPAFGDMSRSTSSTSSEGYSIPQPSSLSLADQGIYLQNSHHYASPGSNAANGQGLYLPTSAAHEVKAGPDTPWTYAPSAYLSTAALSPVAGMPTTGWAFPTSLDTSITSQHSAPYTPEYPATPWTASGYSGNGHSTLTPMLEDFGALSASPVVADPGWRERAFGSRTSMHPGRRRSSTLHSSSTAPSSTLSTPTSAHPAPYPYPQPSRLNRRISLPVAGHGLMMSNPAGYTSIYGTPVVAGKRIHPAPPPGTSPIIYPVDELDNGKKGPRFRPTKEQLEILIASYEENKNPDAAAREALVKTLGGEIKPKTLQIWFQNRRSKARAKEREAGIPKALQLGGRGSRSGASVDLNALKALVHDNDPFLMLVPISVLSLGSWTRFLMPGMGYTHPDLACSISLERQRVFLYVAPQPETFRLGIPITPESILNIQAASNPSITSDALAVRLEISGAVEYAAWKIDLDGNGDWIDWGDFTNGAAEAGGKLEITGDRDVLIPAFTKVEQLLKAAGGRHGSIPITGLDDAHPVTPFPNGWRLPSCSTKVPPTITESPLSSSGQYAAEAKPMPPSYGHLAAYSMPSVHNRARSFSAPVAPLGQVAVGGLSNGPSMNGPEHDPQEAAFAHLIAGWNPTGDTHYTSTNHVVSHEGSLGDSPPLELDDGAVMQ